jgi:hypothetical protein
MTAARQNTHPLSLLESTDNAAEIARLRAMWQEQAAQRAARRAAALRQKLESRRATLLDGSWKPECICTVCLTAILDLQPELLCKDGKAGGKWW